MTKRDKQTMTLNSDEHIEKVNAQLKLSVRERKIKFKRIILNETAEI